MGYSESGKASHVNQRQGCFGLFELEPSFVPEPGLFLLARIASSPVVLNRVQSMGFEYLRET